MKGWGIILPLVLLALPCAAAADSECQVVDYADHYEVVCNGNPAAPVSSRVRNQDSGGASAPRESEPNLVQADPPPERVMLNGLTRSLGESWLKTRPLGR